MDVKASFPTHSEPPELVQQGEGLLDDVAQLPKALDPVRAAVRDYRVGAPVATGLPEGSAVVAFFGEQDRESFARTAGLAGDRRDQVMLAAGSPRLTGDGPVRAPPPAAGLPSRSRYAARTARPADTADPAPDEAPAPSPARPAATVRSAPTARHRCADHHRLSRSCWELLACVPHDRSTQILASPAFPASANRSTNRR